MTDDLIDGYTLAQLGDYLEAGMTPPDPAIDSSPACRLALEALRAVEDATAQSLAREALQLPPPDPAWIRRIVDTISRDVRPGRIIPVAYPDPGLVVTTTEAAIRGLVRAAGDEVPGVIVGRCTIVGDVTAPESPLRVLVDAAMFWAVPLPAAAESLRQAILDAVRSQTDLVVEGVDVTVHDVYALPVESALS